MAFPLLGNSDHIDHIDFFLNSKRDALFHCTAYDQSHADWDGLYDNLRNVPWENIFKGCVCYILLDCFVCLKESSCETRKNVFYFTLKALFIFEIIKF